MEFGQTFTFILSIPPSLQDNSMFEGWQMVLSRKTKKCCGSWKFVLFHDNKNPHKDLHSHAFSLVTLHQCLVHGWGNHSISPAFLNPNWCKMQSTNMQCTNPQSRRSRYPPWETSLERCLNRWIVDIEIVAEIDNILRQKRPHTVSYKVQNYQQSSFCGQEFIEFMNHPRFGTWNTSNCQIGSLGSPTVCALTDWAPRALADSFAMRSRLRASWKGPSILT